MQKLNLISSWRAGISLAVLWCAVPWLGQAQTPFFQWAAKGGRAGDDFGLGIAVDAAGNCFVTGSFSGAATFDQTNVLSAGGQDIFLARYNSTGEFAWVRGAGSNAAEAEEGQAVALDATGNVYVTGGFAGTAGFGGTNLTSAGGLDIFLTKYNNAGEVLWARRAGGSEDSEQGLAIAFDPVGNVLLTGQFQGTASFGNTNLVGRGGTDMFLAKYDLAGNLIWVTQAGGPGADVSRTVAADGAGNSYIAGSFAGDSTFGGGTVITNRGSTDAFVAKYDSLGRFRSVTFIGSDLGEQAYAFGLDGQTNGYLLAWLESTVSNQLGLYKLDPNGNSLWIQSVRVNTDASARGGLAVDAAGNCYFTSHFNGTGVFGTQTLLSQGASDAFAAKFSSAGNLIWTKQILGTTTEEGHAVALDAAGNAYLTGWFRGGISFDGPSVNNGGERDIFVGRLDPAPRLTVRRVEGDQVILAWPKAASGFQVQQTGLLPAGTQWQTLPGTPSVIGDQQVLTNSLASTNTFFRLRKL